MEQENDGSVGRGTRTLLSSLTNLHIAPPRPFTAAGVSQEKEEFSDVFGSIPTPFAPSTSTINPHFAEIIQARSHSFVGPSPRFLSRSPSFPPLTDLTLPEVVSGSQEEDEDSTELGKSEEKESEISVGPAGFEILMVIGQGAFGKVFLVRKKVGEGEGEVFAMKVMNKETIIKRNQADYMRAERDILNRINHPFIVQLRYSFQTKSKLYLILDFINGGHLFFHLYRQGLFREDQARLYAAEIVSAVSHLHKNGIVHRDLKPENVLMDADGHVMLADFGLAKEIDESRRSNSMCGTTEYMAPEIILAIGHNKDADWWSVGVLLFEMLTGQPPFTHSNRQKLQQKIVKGKIKLPAYLSSEAHSLLKGLLQKDARRRLGSGSEGGEEIKSQKWFRQIDWKKLERRELEPKFKPEVSGRECTSNFDNCWTSIPPHDSPAPTPTSDEHFHGYSYVSPFQSQ